MSQRPSFRRLNVISGRQQIVQRHTVPRLFRGMLNHPDAARRNTPVRPRLHGAVWHFQGISDATNRAPYVNQAIHIAHLMHFVSRQVNAFCITRDSMVAQ